MVNFFYQKTLKLLDWIKKKMNRKNVKKILFMKKNVFS